MLGQSHVENTILQGRLDMVGIDCLRQNDRPLESAGDPTVIQIGPAFVLLGDSP